MNKVEYKTGKQKKTKLTDWWENLEEEVEEGWGDEEVEELAFHHFGDNRVHTSFGVNGQSPLRISRGKLFLGPVSAAHLHSLWQWQKRGQSPYSDGKTLKSILSQFTT